MLVHPHTGELAALCAGGSLGFFCWVGSLKYFPMLFLMTDPKSTLSSLWPYSFHLHNWLSLCVFMWTNCSGMHMMCTWPGHGWARSTLLPSLKVLGLGCLYSYPELFWYARASLLALPSLAQVTVPALCLLPKGRVKQSPAGRQMSEDTALWPL